MYNPYHEMDISQFVIEVDNRMREHYEESQLKRLRLYASLTQKELSEKSGVSKRMIEQYEQGRKTLANASATTVISLADALKCDVRELV
jgi:transcriptional regulator with XRE-family HTH domain